MTKKNYTLKEIAKLANVSRGTVDRVIHKRGRVSEEAKVKVEKILNEIDYRPNVFAQSLRSNKNYKIGVLIPKDEEGDYWKQCAAGVEKAGLELLQFGITIVKYRYSSTLTRFEEKVNEAVSLGMDALLMVPIFHGPLKNMFKELNRLKIPIGLINSRVNGIQETIFLGQAYKRSGRLAAQLMDYLVRNNEQGRLLVLHLGIKSGHSEHLLDKENGFKEYFTEKYGHTSIEVLTSPSIEDITDLEIDLNEVAGIYVTTSKIHQLDHILDQHPHIKSIGYDLVPKNIESLKKGRVRVLLNQNPHAQGYQGIHALAELLLYSKEQPKKKLFPVDIVVSENVEEYIT